MEQNFLKDRSIIFAYTNRTLWNKLDCTNYNTFNRACFHIKPLNRTSSTYTTWCMPLHGYYHFPISQVFRYSIYYSLTTANAILIIAWYGWKLPFLICIPIWNYCYEVIIVLLRIGGLKISSPTYCCFILGRPKRRRQWISVTWIYNTWICNPWIFWCMTIWFTSITT